MLLPYKIHPEDSVYYKATFVLDVLNQQRKCTLSDLYLFVRKRRKMSFSVFVLCVDWLFLLGTVCFNLNEEIELCVRASKKTLS